MYTKQQRSKTYEANIDRSKEEIYISTIIAGDFSISLSIKEITSRQKLNKQRI